MATAVARVWMGKSNVPKIRPPKPKRKGRPKSKARPKKKKKAKPSQPVARPVDPKKMAWVAYRDRAWELTEALPLHTLPNFVLRGFYCWHLDHVLSIHEGFRRGLPPESVACLSNLRMIPWKDNMMKHTKTVYTDLFNDVY